MKNLLMLICLLVPGLCSASDASGIMAEILIGLNHFPSESDKSALDELAANSAATENEKVLAGAIQRIAHKPAAGDVETLRAIETGTASPEEKTLAIAILSINHKPSATSLTALNKLLE